MTISANIIADSRCSETGRRITTFELNYPRIVHAELMTHRVFSRNASSSRAIPVERLIEEARTAPAMPVRFGANQRGMQDKGGDHNQLIALDGSMKSPQDAWRFAANQMAEIAKAFTDAGYHKQVANRLLEPFTHIKVLVTSTYWANFYALRNHPKADPTMEALAKVMWEAHEVSVPAELRIGDWHLPYITEAERRFYEIPELRIMSSARSARVSYNRHQGGVPSYEEDLSLYQKLVTDDLVHASPTEHQATPDPTDRHREAWGNFKGFIQFRKLIPNEAIND